MRPLSQRRAVAAALAVIALVVAFGSLREAAEPDTWTGSVYPDRNNLHDDVTVGTFESLSACRNACRAELRRIHAGEDDPLEIGDYGCGLNCEQSETGVLMVCEETKR